MDRYNIGNREHADDDLVALTAAFEAWCYASRPREGHDRLSAAVKGKPELETKLNSLRKSASSAMRQSRKREHDGKKRSDRQHRQKELERANIAKYLTARAIDVRTVDEHSMDRCFPALWLLAGRIRELADDGFKWGSDRWDLLETEINREVAEAARDGLMRFWRLYTPQLHVESTGNARTNGVLTGLVGLAIEARERQDWVRKLTPEEAQIASRYAMHELNGLPDWALDLMEVHPEAFDSVAIPELNVDSPADGGGRAGVEDEC